MFECCDVTGWFGKYQGKRAELYNHHRSYHHTIMINHAHRKKTAFHNVSSIRTHEL